MNLHLSDDIGKKDIKTDGLRAGFGEGLLEAGRRDENVVALCADLTDSTKMNMFAEEFPERFVEIGVAEQNLVTVASGMAAMGKLPFTSSYAAFSPGRNWEQIRTTICLNEQPVKIVGSHAGVSVGPDGATHQMLEDIALMRVLPHMIVVAPGDAIEAKKATLALAQDYTNPGYIRLARAATPVFTTEKTPFSLDRAHVYRSGTDITLIGTGTMTYHCLVAADELHKHGVDAEVIHCPVIKPLDGSTIMSSVQKTKHVLTAEEGQIKGGLAGAVAEFLMEHHPVPMARVGINDEFGQSGEPEELLNHYGLNAEGIVTKTLDLLKSKK